MPHKDSVFQLRRKEKVPLHDEADLVNFRADSLARLVTNQDYLENASLKPFHTSHIAPPTVFPIHSKKAYLETASDEDVKTVAKNLKPEEVYSGDFRLMRAKLALLQEEWALLEKEDKPSETVFSEETRFQRAAVEKIAKLQSESNSFASLEKMEDLLNKLMLEYKQKFSKDYTLQQNKYRKHSIPVLELAPDVEIKLAPALYNPRLINSYLEMKEDTEKQDLEGNSNNGQSLSNSNEFISENGFEDFGIIYSQEDRMDSRIGGAWSEQQGTDDFIKDVSLPYAQEYNGKISTEFGNEPKQHDSEPKPAMADNMVDLNQFLNEGAESGMDEMNALIDFDHDNNTGADATEEPFCVDFLNDMGMDLN